MAARKKTTARARTGAYTSDQIRLARRELAGMVERANTSTVYGVGYVAGLKDAMRVLDSFR